MQLIVSTERSLSHATDIIVKIAVFTTIMISFSHEVLGFETLLLFEIVVGFSCERRKNLVMKRNGSGD